MITLTKNSLPALGPQAVIAQLETTREVIVYMERCRQSSQITAEFYNKYLIPEADKRRHTLALRGK